MKLIGLEKKKVMLKDLEFGYCFTHNDNYYMKCFESEVCLKSSQPWKAEVPYLIVNLVTGEISAWVDEKLEVAAVDLAVSEV